MGSRMVQGGCKQTEDGVVAGAGRIAGTRPLASRERAESAAVASVAARSVLAVAFLICSSEFVALCAKATEDTVSTKPVMSAGILIITMACQGCGAERSLPRRISRRRAWSGSAIA